MKIVHVVPNVDLDSGGPSYSVTRLCEGLHCLTPNVHLFTTTTGLPAVNCAAPIRKFPVIGSRRLGFSPKLKAALNDERLGQGDILHSHGLWMLPNIYPGAIKKRYGCKLILSSRGMLAPWSLAQSRLKKRIASMLGQADMLSRVDCFHATAESEYEDIRRLGFRQPVAIIPNDVDMPEKNSSQRKRQVLLLSRIHPKKGIETLLQAWERIQTDAGDWKLVICGPGESAYLKHIQQQIAACPGHVRYKSPVFDAHKSTLIHESSLFVLPTKSENFGIVVAEALAHGVPVIVTKGAPWQGVEFNQCGWWIEDDVASLALALKEALSLSLEQLTTMGLSGREWMAREYSWQGVARRMYETYRWLHGEVNQPTCVFTE